MREDVGVWMFVHTVFFTPHIAGCVYLLLDGVKSRAATVSRIAVRTCDGLKGRDDERPHPTSAKALGYADIEGADPAGVSAGSGSARACGSRGSDTE